MNRDSSRTLGLIGHGAFGRFIAPHLEQHFNVVVYDPRIKDSSIESAATCDVVVLAPPVQQLASVIDAIAPHVRPGALVVDVASVKLRPVALMRERLPQSVDIVGLHPLFGPQSGRNGISGLPIVVCPVRPANPASVIEFLANKLRLAVTVQTPDEHDRAMAHVQALTHFVAAALSGMELPDVPAATPSYNHLRAFVDMVRFDSPELYRAIQCENPYAEAIRKEFTGRVEVLSQGTL